MNASMRKNYMGKRLVSATISFILFYFHFISLRIQAFSSITPRVQVLTLGTQGTLNNQCKKCIC